jgi:hypothetical protein
VVEASSAIPAALGASRRIAFRSFWVIATAANDASGLDEALQTAVDEICAHTGWPVGHAYVGASEWSRELVPSDIWHLADPHPIRGLWQGDAGVVCRLRARLAGPGPGHRQGAVAARRPLGP